MQETFDDFDFEAENGPQSGVRDMSESGEYDIGSLQRRAESGRRQMARVFRIFSANEDDGQERALKAHVDPFDTAIDAEAEVA